MIIFNETDNLEIELIDTGDSYNDLVITFKGSSGRRPDVVINLFNDCQMTAKRMAQFGAKIIKAVYMDLSEEDKEEILYSMEQE